MNFIKSFRLSLIAFFLFFFNVVGYSQDLLKGKDLSQIKVDMISASDLEKLKSQLSSAGISLDQAEQMAVSKGMPAIEAAKLKQKLTTTVSTNVATDAKKTSKVNVAERENSETEMLANEKTVNIKGLINPLIFGSELYNSVSMSFEPNLKMATPVNYILGPSDQILVTVYGVQEYSENLNISSEGSIFIPNVGEVKLAGMNIEAATQKLKTILGNSVYPYLKTGGAKLSVSLSKIRTISVTIIGSNRPGNYKISSLSSVFNALFISGGPSAFGSYREIELVRNNVVIRKIDLYKFLMEGSQEDNVSLKDNDVIRIPTYKTRVTIRGEVKRRGIFEVLPGESFSKILKFASGFTDNAYMGSVKVFQRNEKERQIQDLIESQYNSYFPKSGDVFEVSEILERFKNRVIINGAVFRPGQYELTNNLHVSDLINKSDGLKPDAFTERGQIIRFKEDLTKTLISFDIKKALAGDSKENILLQKEDSVIVTSILDLIDKYIVTIQGEVRVPGRYDFVEKTSLKDLILQAGGFTDASYRKIEIARILKKDSLSMTDNQSSTIYKIEIEDKDLSTSGASNFILEPMDVVTVRRIASYEKPITVEINGQVQYPGPYVLGITSERVSDLLKRAGGFAPDAYLEGAYIKRFKSLREKELAKDAFDKLQKASKDSSSNLEDEILREFDKIPLDMEKVLKNPGSTEDIILKEKDEIVIPKFDAQVKVSGEVLMSTQIPFESGRNLKYYIDAAGGFTSNAIRSKIYVVYANGKASATSHFLFFKSYPKIKAGSELIVPRKREKKASNTAEIIGIASAVASLAGVVIAITRL